MKTSGQISANATADEFKAGIEQLYKDNWGTGINCNLTMFDEDGVETDNFTLGVTRVYDTELHNLITGKTWSKISFLPITTESEFNATLPEDIQLSAPPLSGRMRIKCVDEDGMISYSNTFDFSHDANYVNHYLQSGCSKFYDATEVHDTNEF